MLSLHNHVRTTIEDSDRQRRRNNEAVGLTLELPVLLFPIADVFLANIWSAAETYVSLQVDSSMSKMGRLL